MGKFIYNAFIIILIALGVVLLMGKNHYLLGSILGLCQGIIMIIGGVVLFGKRKKGFKLMHKILFLVIGLMFFNWSYENIHRLSLKGTANTEHEVSILTYNLFFKNKHTRQIIDEIKAVDADIVIVQELTSDWEATLQNQIHGNYNYRKSYVNNGTHGFGILSKYPIQSCEYLKNTSNLPVNQITKLSIQGKELVIVNAHLASPARAVENPDNFFELYESNAQQRNAEWKTLEKHLSEKYQGIPQVVAGDLNTMKIEPLYRKIRYTWKDLFAKKGWGMGWNFPNTSKIPIPLITLDYILYKGDVKPIESRVLEGSSSDHLAIYGKIEI